MVRISVVGAKQRSTGGGGAVPFVWLGCSLFSEVVRGLEVCDGVRRLSRGVRRVLDFERPKVEDQTGPETTRIAN